MTEIIYNDRGAGQSKVDERYDLIPPDVLKQVATVLGEGAEKYGEWNWTGINVSDHINHALRHINEFQLGNCEDSKVSDHLSHVLCRIIFAYHLTLNPHLNDEQ